MITNVVQLHRLIENNTRVVSQWRTNRSMYIQSVYKWFVFIAKRNVPKVSVSITPYVTLLCTTTETFVFKGIINIFNKKV
jgi:hypothetical protein